MSVMPLPINDISSTTFIIISMDVKSKNICNENAHFRLFCHFNVNRNKKVVRRTELKIYCVMHMLAIK